MLGSGKTEAVRAFVAARSARSQDADVYRRYAAALYRHALLTHGDPPPAEHVVYDVLVNEAALARIPEPGGRGAHCLLRDEAHRCRGPQSRTRG